ncbi:response regulator transcription factor [Streptomyces ficellus]|uniref:Response regulator transcription factor n=1 Tax=Streptomyces ficellus TaxID=1977088 RepID=A0ABT7Z3M3_9ACTN|nr:response regulator transcription factor [Streptomyces ficellus]MDN3294093.1 response regulator transcription factor [Streptomyces ficellus]
MSIKVLVADDHAAVRAGLVLVLERAGGIEVVGQAVDGTTAISMARQLRPDVVLMDVRMPGGGGIAATRVLVQENVCQVLVLTTFDLDEYVYAALQAGAAGFLIKSIEALRLVEAIHLVAQGDGVLAPQVTRRVMAHFAGTSNAVQPNPEGLGQLTDRERDVLDCLGEGLSNQQIAHRLYITEATVKSHVSHILAKLGLRSRVQAAILVQEHGRTDR